MPSPKESLSPTPESTDTESTASVMPRPIPRSSPMEPPSPTLSPLPTPWPPLPTAVWSTLPWWACHQLPRCPGPMLIEKTNKLQTNQFQFHDILD